MTFWQDATIEPKRAYRFLLSVSGRNTTIKNFLIKKVNKRYAEILKKSGEDPISILKNEFKLSTSEIWEILGIKDELEKIFHLSQFF